MDNYLFDIDKSTAIYGAWPWLRTFRTHPMMFASLIGHVSQAPFVFVISPVGIVAAWVTLLYAVGLREVRRCKHWSERYGEPRFWTRFREGRSRHSRLHPDHRPRGATTPLGIAVSSGDCGYAIAASFPHRNRFDRLFEAFKIGDDLVHLRSNRRFEVNRPLVIDDADRYRS